MAGLTSRSLPLSAATIKQKRMSSVSITQATRMKYWGKWGSFWGGLWGLLVGAAFLIVPGVGPVVAARLGCRLDHRGLGRSSRRGRPQCTWCRALQHRHSQKRRCKVRDVDQARQFRSCRTWNRRGSSESPRRVEEFRRGANRHLRALDRNGARGVKPGWDDSESRYSSLPYLRQWRLLRRPLWFKCACKVSDPLLLAVETAKSGASSFASMHWFS